MRGLACVVLAACGSGGTPATTIFDAPAAGIDAPLVVPDGPAAAPDAPLVTPDARPAAPDAHPAAPDAPIAIDAGPPPDAAPPDAPFPLVSGKDIAIAGKPLAMGQNAVAQRLYVSMTTPPGQPFGGAGVAVIDMGTDSVVTTLPAPTANSLKLVFNSLAADETANKVYAASNTVQALYVIDGATNAFAATPVALPAPQFGSSYAAAVAIDNTAKRLYAWLFVTSGGQRTQNVTVFDATTMDVLASVPLAGFAEGTSNRLAVDPQKHLLFACGDPATDPSAGALVATIDTTTNQQQGTVQSFPAASEGYFVDCKAGPGYGTLVTNGTGSGATLHELDPVAIKLPDHFVPDTYDVEGVELGQVVWFFGHSDITGSALFFSVLTSGNVVLNQDPLVYDLSRLGSETDHRIYASTVRRVAVDHTQKVFVSQILEGDGGPNTPKTAVTVLVIR